MVTLFEHACDGCDRAHKTTACKKATRIELGNKYTVHCSKYQGENEIEIRLLPSMADILKMSSIVLCMFDDSMLPQRVKDGERTVIVTKEEVSNYLKKRADELGYNKTASEHEAKLTSATPKTIVKPPLGIKPLSMAVEAFHNERLAEIVSAIKRFSEANVVIPKEWADELEGYVALLMTRGNL